jgi:hypothetical protein
MLVGTSEICLGTTLNSVSGTLVSLISSESRVCELKDRDVVGLSASRFMKFARWTALIG